MDALNENDVIHVAANRQRDSDQHVEVTHVRVTKVGKLLREVERDEDYWKQQLTRFAGREIKDSDTVRVVEVHAILQLSLDDKFHHYLDSRY